MRPRATLLFMFTVAFGGVSTLLLLLLLPFLFWFRFLSCVVVVLLCLSSL